MLVKKEPVSWRDLQKCVAEIFEDMNYQVLEDAKSFELRGGDTVDLDVWVMDKESPSKFIYIIECKYWKKKVNKEKVHALRTVVSDAGASIGYIISKSEFQEGALEAAKQTNIRLLTWDEFQMTFENQWVKKMLTRSKEKVDIITSIPDLLAKRSFDENITINVLKLIAELSNIAHGYTHEDFLYKKNPFNTYNKDGSIKQKHDNRKKFFEDYFKQLDEYIKKLEKLIGIKLT
ncbi:hypothetical protein J2X07_003721 [Fictibacillus barbaricus]|uniref:Restriction endonuclease type IV Mrr domain-containing protein n=2 Tax=Fictibacillus barbaricus TaxID=182136 RepID=A0ABU1U5G2_9BACL|nr:hypothetical protein [Fictibacillus barbaricus]